MIKKSITVGLITLFVLVLSALSVNATASFELLNTSVSLEGLGSTPSENILINNTGDETLTFNIYDYQLSKNSHHINVSNIADFSLDAGQSTTKGISVTVPANQYAGIYTGTLKIDSNATDPQDLSVSLNVTENPSFNVLNKPTSTINANISDILVDVPFSIENTGNTDLTIFLKITGFENKTQLEHPNVAYGPSHPDYDPTPYEIDVPFNTTKDHNETFYMFSNSYDGIYTGTINATSGELYEAFDVTLDLDGIADICIEFTAPTIVQGESDEEMIVTIKNNGNKDIDSLDYNIEPTFKYGSTELAFSPTSGTITDLEFNELGCTEITDLTTGETSKQEGQNITLTFDQIPLNITEDDLEEYYFANMNATWDGGNSTKLLKVYVEERDEDIYLSQDPGDPYLVKGADSGSAPIVDKVNIELVIENDGNVDLSNVVVSKKSDFVGNFENITLAAKDQLTGISIPVGGTHNITFEASIDDSNYSNEVYNALINVSYSDKSQTYELKVGVRNVINKIEADVGAVIFDEATRNSTVTKTFTITNTGDQALSSLVINSTLDDKFSPQFASSPTGETIGVGSSKNVTVTLNIPEDQDSGEHAVGNVDIHTNKATLSVPLRLTTESKLEITDADFIHKGDSKDMNNDGTYSDDLRPGDTIYLEVEVKNNYDDSTDIEMEDVEILGTLEEVDDGSDVEDESDGVDIKPEKSKRERLKFEIPADAEEGVYDLVIEVTGEDTNNADHTATWNLKVDVEKKEHDIAIKEAKLRLEALKCVRTTTLDVKLKNVGGSNEDEVKLKIESPDLGINFKQRNLEMSKEYDEDSNEYSYSLPITVADDVAAGAYRIRTTVFYSDDITSDIKDVDLVIQSCGGEEIGGEDDKQDTAGGKEDEGKETDAGKEQEEDFTETEEIPFTETGGYIAVLVIMSLLIVGGLGFIVYKFLLIKD